MRCSSQPDEDERGSSAKRRVLKHPKINHTYSYEANFETVEVAMVAAIVRDCCLIGQQKQGVVAIVNACRSCELIVAAVVIVICCIRHRGKQTTNAHEVAAVIENEHCHCNSKCVDFGDTVVVAVETDRCSKIADSCAHNCCCCSCCLTSVDHRTVVVAVDTTTRKELTLQ